MNNHQLRPLEVNPATGEPFLRLRKHSNVIITPPRLSDCPRIASLIGDPIIYEQLSGAPVPYLVEHAEAYMSRTKPQADAIFKALVDAEEQEELLVVDGCPVSYIREIQSDGSDLLIGHISEFLGPQGPKVIEWEHREELREENLALELGDPEIVWTIKVFLSASHHGKGIATDAINTVLHDWAIPRMGVRRLLAFPLEGNHGAVKLFLKSGFEFLFGCSDSSVLRGIRRRVNVLEWRLDDGEA
ncbi:hypothetical protein DFP72DRAFT_1010015 [Ephemerocybe angulata]|uniref:N-acetyltransferase domain-containing protein n=1 Tax=Ephemerocybe angulata TaxID=980116 RepID=A0A8H6HXU3_9AGAR|nr:hypothetical protein DFP72DRAFT_1010015 [Tulosesus angulatus]